MICGIQVRGLRNGVLRMVVREVVVVNDAMRWQDRGLVTFMGVLDGSLHSVTARGAGKDELWENRQGL